MEEPTVSFSRHALEQMYARDIAEAEVREVLEHGDVIERYLDDLFQPTALILGWVDGKPLHVVAAYPAEGIIFIITTYRPDPRIWKPGFRKRR